MSELFPTSTISVNGQEIKQHGAVWYNTPQGRFLLEEGDGIFLNSGTLHTSEAIPEHTCKKSDLIFHGRLIYGSRDSILYQKYMQPLMAPDAFQTLVLRKNVPWHFEILGRIKKASRLCQNKPEGYEFTVRNLLADVFFDLYCYQNAPSQESSAATASESDRIKQMLLYLQENYARPVTVAELASHANICERECLRCFKRMLHLSPIQYLIHYRIARSCILLRESDLSILEISSRCGFESPSYFTKTFHRIVGSTPTQYRNTPR